ncbi:MAG: hypothetical protein ACUVX8_06240 [Candidatus Zipacnadales bacterium]
MLPGTETSIKVSGHFTVDELQGLIHFICTGLVQIDPLISYRRPLRKLQPFTSPCMRICGRCMV